MYESSKTGILPETNNDPLRSKTERSNAKMLTTPGSSPVDILQRTQIYPGSLSRVDVQQLQSAFGNQMVIQLLENIDCLDEPFRPAPEQEIAGASEGDFENPPDVIQGIFTRDGVDIGREIIERIAEYLERNRPELVEDFEKMAYDTTSDYGEISEWLELYKVNPAVAYSMDELAGRQLEAAKAKYAQKGTGRELQAPTMAVGRFITPKGEVLKTSNQRNLPGTEQQAGMDEMEMLAQVNSYYQNMHGEMGSVHHYLESVLHGKDVRLLEVGASQEICFLCEMILTILNVDYDHAYISKILYPKWDDPTSKFKDKDEQYLTLKALLVDKLKYNLQEVSDRLVQRLRTEEMSMEQAIAFADRILNGELQSPGERRQLIADLKKIPSIAAKNQKRTGHGSSRGGKPRTKQARREAREQAKARREARESAKSQSAASLSEPPKLGEAASEDQPMEELESMETVREDAGSTGREQARASAAVAAPRPVPVIPPPLPLHEGPNTIIEPQGWDCKLRLKEGIVRNAEAQELMKEYYQRHYSFGCFMESSLYLSLDFKRENHAKAIELAERIDRIME